MSTLRISRTHEMDHDECRSVAEDLLNQLVAKFGGSIREKGDCYSYRHATGLNAEIEPRNGALDIVIKFTMMTRAFAPLVEEQINIVLDEHIGGE